MRVAVVIPVKDAATLLPDCVAHVLAQTLPAAEILVVVAPSRDETAAVAASLASDRVRVVANLAGDRGSAINAALDATDAEVVAPIDAQAVVASDYLEAACTALDDPSIAVAGGPMHAVGRTAVGRALARALRSPFGIGDSQFHFGGAARDVDSVYLGVYRRGAFERVGRYNPELLRTEDDDMNARIRDAGMRIRLDPAIRSTYLCRDRLAEIWTQYRGYGYWKVALMTIRPEALRWRHAIPAAFVVGLLTAAVLAVFGLWLPLAMLGGSYVLAAAAFAIVAGSNSPRRVVLFFAVAATMHVAYGVGTLLALPRWRQLRRRVRRGAVTGQAASDRAPGSA